MRAPSPAVRTEDQQPHVTTASFTVASTAATTMAAAAAATANGTVLESSSTATPSLVPPRKIRRTQKPPPKKAKSNTKSKSSSSSSNSGKNKKGQKQRGIRAHDIDDLVMMTQQQEEPPMDNDNNKLQQEQQEKEKKKSEIKKQPSRILDECPDRITNPLVVLEATTSHNPTATITTTTTTITTTTEAVEGSAHHPNNNNNNNTKLPISADALVTLTEGIPFHRPDTYSIQYYARLLGIPLAPLLAHHSKHPTISSVFDFITGASSKPSSHHQPAADVNPQKDDPIFTVPRLGEFPDHLKFWIPSSHKNNDSHQKKNNVHALSENDDEDYDVVWMQEPNASDCFDPLYKQLLQHSALSVVHVPITQSEHNKLLPLNSSTLTAAVVATTTIPPMLATASTATNATTAYHSSHPVWNVQQQLVLDSVRSVAIQILGHEFWDAQNDDKVVEFWPLELAREIIPTNKVETFLAECNSSNRFTLGSSSGMAAAAATADAASSVLGIMTGWVAVEKDLATTEEPAATIIGGLVYQFEWYRSIFQRVEDSEMIAHVVGMNICKQATSTHRTQWLQLMLTSLVLEHIRHNQVWYAIFHAESSSHSTLSQFWKNHFRMTSSLSDASILVCDINKCSTRYAFLRYAHDGQQPRPVDESGNTSKAGESQDLCSRNEGNLRDDSALDNSSSAASALYVPKHRWLVRLPMEEDVRKALKPSEESVNPEDGKHKRMNDRLGGVEATSADVADIFFTSADLDVRNVVVGLRVVLDGNIHTESSKIVNMLRLNPDDNNSEKGEFPCIESPAFNTDIPSLDILRHFPLTGTPTDLNSTTSPRNERMGLREQEDSGCKTFDSLLNHLKQKQSNLLSVEANQAPLLRNLLCKVVQERIEFEKPESIARRHEENWVLAECKRRLELRKELDLAMQKQLEQDMDAVCEICLDGEVTPDNQILFCEACNVAVHQICYGIEKVPVGDYYCIPCRSLGRDKHYHYDTHHLANSPQPLPICCELCPLPHGAFIRTDVKSKPGDTNKDKWVHVVCAKWQGLNFVNIENPDLVEDVTELKIGFRRLGIKCELCQGERGAMNKCSGSDNCKKWFHVTCARAVGTLSVVHGENCEGPVEKNPWCLMCQEHSEGSAIAAVPKKLLSVEELIKEAQKFPPDPKPPPEAKPFNVLTGEERKMLLADSTYENALISELLTKKFFGVRCEVCDRVEDDSKNLTRCFGCNVIFCNACKLLTDQMRGNYRCPSCLYIEKNDKEVSEFGKPKCCACYEVGGFLREAFAEPFNKKYYWKNLPDERKRSFLFYRQIWIHSVCAFWHPKLTIPFDTGIVDMSNVVLANGRNFILDKYPCYLCGQRGGLKVKCSSDGCCLSNGDSKQHTVMHVTCARQAGFEVVVDDSKDTILFHTFCYRHGGNEYNLRAKMEDMVEIEKRRAGKDNSRWDYPMTFSDGSRILNAAILVMKVLGWAWRWAELWVDYNSSWEPLLEPGQNERKMTKEQLKIVDSTRESRCADARRCRLAAVGAALRNRNYDTPEGFNQVALDRALRAILHTKSLVGPLERWEIDFFVEWLGRAYRSKSRLLGFGDDKIPISCTNEYCVFKDGQVPKFELGDRPLPGLQELPEGTFSEVEVREPDDFMLRDILCDLSVPSERIKGSKPHAINDSRAMAKKSMDRRIRRPGRPPRNSRLEEECGKDLEETAAQQGSDISLGVSPSVKLEAAGASERSRLFPNERLGLPTQVCHSDALDIRSACTQQATNSNAPVKRGRGRPKKIRTPEDTGKLCLNDLESAEAKMMDMTTRLSNNMRSHVDRLSDTHEALTSNEQGYVRQQRDDSDNSSPPTKRKAYRPRKKRETETIIHESSVAEISQGRREIDASKETPVVEKIAARDTIVNQNSTQFASGTATQSMGTMHDLYKKMTAVASESREDKDLSGSPITGPNILESSAGFETKIENEVITSKKETGSTIQVDDRNGVETSVVPAEKDGREGALLTNTGRAESADQSSLVLMDSGVKMEAAPAENTEITNVAPSAAGSVLYTDYPVHSGQSRSRLNSDAVSEIEALSVRTIESKDMSSNMVETDGELKAGAAGALYSRKTTSSCCETDTKLEQTSETLHGTLVSNVAVDEGGEIPVDCNDISSKYLESQSLSSKEIKVETVSTENIENKEAAPSRRPSKRKHEMISLSETDPTTTIETNLDLPNVANDQVKRRRRTSAPYLVIKKEVVETTPNQDQPQLPRDESVEKRTRKTTRSRGRGVSLTLPAVEKEEDGISIAELVARRKPEIPATETPVVVDETRAGHNATEMVSNKMDGTESQSMVEFPPKEEEKRHIVPTTAPHDPGMAELRSNDTSLSKDDASSSPQKLGRLRGKKMAASSILGTGK